MIYQNLINIINLLNFTIYHYYLIKIYYKFLKCNFKTIFSLLKIILKLRGVIGLYILIDLDERVTKSS